MTPKTKSPRPVPDSQAEARCHCGQLMAILRKDGVELKCKRCKRITLIPFSSFIDDPVSSPLPPASNGEGIRSCLVDVHART